jgi:16S rRNA (uracil1498-N3)-methyltransferase
LKKNILPDRPPVLRLSSGRESPDEIRMLVGPEGGLEADEVGLLKEKGFVPVSLGPRTLRAETAAVAALAVLQHRWGDLR